MRKEIWGGRKSKAQGRKSAKEERTKHEGGSLGRNKGRSIREEICGDRKNEARGRKSAEIERTKHGEGSL